MHRPNAVSRSLVAALCLGTACSTVALAAAEEADDFNTTTERTAGLARPQVMENPNATPSTAVPPFQFNDPSTHFETEEGFIFLLVGCVCDAEYFVGERVYATVDEPAGASGVVRGTQGTVISGNADLAGGEGRILVAWDGYTAGHGGNGFTQCPPNESETAENRWWVPCDTIRTFGPLDCGCGDGIYEVGDRVVATSGELGGSTAPDGLGLGSVGTVVAGRSGGSGGLDVLVEWDGWAGGHGGNGISTCPPNEAPGQTNRWWVKCEQIEFLAGNGSIDCACQSQYDNGDIVVVTNGGFEGGTYGVGRRGQVIAGREFFGGTTLVLVQFEGWYDGHDGIYSTEVCPAFGLYGESRWWVPCDDIARIGDCPADLNADGLINGADLTILLGSWGGCP